MARQFSKSDQVVKSSSGAAEVTYAALQESSKKRRRCGYATAFTYAWCGRLSRLPTADYSAHRLRRAAIQNKAIAVAVYRVLEYANRLSDEQRTQLIGLIGGSARPRAEISLLVG